MFEALSDKLKKVIKDLRGESRLSPEHLDLAMREIRIALLEADVNFKVVKDFVERVKAKALGQEVLQQLSPGQQVIKIVNDELVTILGGENVPLEHKGNPGIVMMVGLQGSGKTTTSAKIAKRLTERQGKKVLMASLDTRRPAAQEQLAVLGQQIGVATLPIIAGQEPRAIALVADQDECVTAAQRMQPVLRQLQGL